MVDTPFFIFSIRMMNIPIPHNISEALPRELEITNDIIEFSIYYSHLSHSQIVTFKSKTTPPHPKGRGGVNYFFFFSCGLITSTIAFLGFFLASSTGINRPFSASRPIFLPFSFDITLLHFRNKVNDSHIEYFSHRSLDITQYSQQPIFSITQQNIIALS